MAQPEKHATIAMRLAAACDKNALDSAWRSYYRQDVSFLTALVEQLSEERDAWAASKEDAEKIIADLEGAK